VTGLKEEIREKPEKGPEQHRPREVNTRLKGIAGERVCCQHMFLRESSGGVAPFVGHKERGMPPGKHAMEIEERRVSPPSGRWEENAKQRAAVETGGREGQGGVE